MGDNAHKQQPLEDRIRKAFSQEEPRADLAAVMDRATRHPKAAAGIHSETGQPVASTGLRTTLTVVMADDHRDFAERLGGMLDAEDDIEILGIARDGEEALELVTQQQPDILLLEAHLPGTDLVPLLREAKAKAPGTKLVVLSADTRRETVDLAMEAGADGFLPKELTGWQLAGAIRKLLEAQDAPLTPALPPWPVRDPTVKLRVRTLSAREREILALLVNGHSNRRIADECLLSLNTVRTHIQNLLVKLGVHSKLEAVAFALQHQVIPLGEGAPLDWSTEQRPGSTS